MHEAERDGTAQAEDVAAAELRELGREDAALEDVLELGPEGIEDDGQERPPDGKGGGDDGDPQPVGAPGVGEQGAVHAPVPASAPFSGSVS